MRNKMRREEMKMRSWERFSPPFIVKEIFAASRSGSTICRKSFFPAPSPPKGFTITISFLGRPVSHDLQQQPFVTHTHIAVGKKNQVLLLSTVFFLKSFFQRSQRCSLTQELLSKMATMRTMRGVPKQWRQSSELQGFQDSSWIIRECFSFCF